MSDITDGWLNRGFEQVDTVDVFAVILLIAGGAVISNFATITVAGFDLNSIAYTLGSATELTWAMILPAVGLGLAVSTNEFDREGFEKMSKGEQAAIATVVVGLLAVVFAPDIASLVQDNIYAGGVYTALHGGAGLVIASE